MSVLVTARGVGIVLREATHAVLDRVTPRRGPVPLRIEGVTVDWLQRALGAPKGSIRSVEVLGADTGTAGRARIAVDADAALALPEVLFVKLMPRSMVQHLLMNVFDLGTREVLVYRALGDAPPVRVPRCYASVLDERRHRNLMVLEDLSPTATFRTVVDSVSAAEAEAVVDAFADLHAAFWDSPRFAGDLRPITGRSPGANALGDTIRKRLLGKLSGPAAELVPPDVQAASRIFFERSAAIDAFWATQPQTLIHGDPHLGNLFFEDAAPGFLDWQVATTSSGLRDVAYFANASVEPALLRTIERGLVERYAARLDAVRIPVDVDHLWTLYRAGITEIYLAAVATASSGERMQPYEISRVGVARALAGVQAHDSFDILTALIKAH